MILRKLLMLVFLAVAVCVMSAGVGAAAVITVDDSGGADFTSIQAAVDAASDGDTIEVRSGMYVENVDVDKQLTLHGIDDGGGMPVVDAANSSDHVFLCNADDVTISGFNITGATERYKSGLYLNGVQHNTISNNKLSNNYVGVLLDSSSYNDLSNNKASHNMPYGIYLRLSSNNNSLSNNTVLDNYYGIYLWSNCNGNTLINNNVSNNNKGLDLWSNCNGNTLNNNTVNLNKGTGIYLRYSSNNNKLSNNTVLNNKYHGISLYGSDYNILNNNTINSNIYTGITISLHSNYNKLIGNTANSNIGTGIKMGTSSDNTVSGNNANSNTDYGIYLSGSSNDNILFHNNFENNNNYNAYDEKGDIYHSNQWDSGTEGNYYGDDYTGTDSDGDGIGDTTYPIPGGSSVDRYPLMAPYSPTPPPTVPQDKSLLQVEGQPEVYWFQNSRLYWITDWNVINHMSTVPGWDSVNTFLASEFNPADYEQGPRLIATGVESDGLLIRQVGIRQVGDYKVYRIENGMKRHITYPDVMDLKGYSFDDVIEVSSEISNMFQVGEPIGIEVDLYFNKSIDSVKTSHESQFTTDETVKLITETTVAEDYTVETYVKMINPDGTEKYAYYENVDFLITDQLKFSDTERPLYPGTWHAQTKKWNWNEYVFIGDEIEGIYTWEFWYKDTVTGKVLGKDVQGYEFSKTPPSPVDIIPPFISIINPLDGTTIFKDDNILIYGIAFDPSGIETLTINNENVISHQVFGVVPFFTFVNLNEGLNEVTISARDSSENYNEITERIIVNYYPFDVKINSPNDMDRYTPEESMNIYAEVTGGTPLFTYKWIIDELNSIGEIQNHVEYPGLSSDESIELPVLESTIYEIQLEVTDSKGFTIKTEQKRIIISPQDVDSGFLPNPDGYQFVNFGSEGYSWMANSPADPLLLMQTTGGYSWDYFRRAYGSDEVEINGIPSLWAKNFFYRQYTEVGNPGNCFGMSASSLVIWHSDNNRNNFNSWDLAGSTDLPLFGRNRPLDSDDSIFDYNDNGIWDPAPRTWGIFPDFIYTPTEWVEYYQPLQHSAAAVSDKAIYDNPNTVYDELKLSMAYVWIDNPMMIGMEWYLSDGKFAGHAVVPYKIEEAEDHRTGKVFIYDSKYPGEEGHFILFNLETKTAKNDEYNGGNDLSTVRAIKLSSISRDDHQMSNSDSVNNWAGHLLYTDAIGRHLGFYNGEFKDEIPGTSIINSWGQNENDQFMEIYYISDFNLKRELYGVDNGIATVSISRPNNLVIADVQVSPNSVDELNVPADGSSVEFISGEGTSTISLMLDRENSEFARVVRITGSEIESENGVQISFSDDLTKVSIMNIGLPHGYDLYLEQIGSNPSSYNSLRQIIVEENSAVWITPLDWNDIDNNVILIEYDLGNDGTIESNEMMNTYNISFLPPITTMDQFNLTDGSTLPIKFTVRDRITNEFIYDDTVNVTITNSTGHLITYFTNGTGTDSVRINSEEEQYIANFHTKDYAINIGETYSVTVTFG